MIHVGLPSWLLVGLGGLVGSVGRYLGAGLVHRLLPRMTFPVGTLVVNVAGCLVIGLLAGLADSRGVMRSETRALLLIGVLGGFTTFSTFGYETLQLVRDAQFARASLNVLAHVALGLAAVWAGDALARSV
jgi:CrcB protein